MSVESAITSNVNGGSVFNNGDQKKPFKIFVGYDPREDLAYQVCRYSILKRSSISVEVIPIKQSELREKKYYWRERNKLESTEFSFTRFLTPFLANYEVMCVQHDYTPKEATKMDGVVQTVYPRKNWSSMVLYNCSHLKNRILTPEVVNKESGAYLHRFQWLEDDEIGSVPFVWNFLVGHNQVVNGDLDTFPKAIHYTSGGPWFEAWRDCEFGDLWLKELEEFEKMNSLKC
ncbi:protein CDI-like isoform X2 [Cynara cardunculus var. scolymus]|uniref:protein CDI-like isoform X2 n=1 Tax=Cynara cardunculus var. scolymus TaxID=59895 RepID=UPI000D630110|nr:protein CDI-like isoform X2 [Cynara cardunculus var. scolymus]